LNDGDTLDGWLDEVMIYDRVLDPAEVRQLYEQDGINPTNALPIAKPEPFDSLSLREGLELYCDFDKNTDDKSRHASRGTIKGDPRWVSGVKGYALEMAERSSWVEYPRGLLNPRTKPWSISIWISMNPGSGFRESQLLSVANAQGPGFAGANWYSIAGGGDDYRLAGLLRFAMRSDVQSSQTECVPQFRFGDGKWHHIAAVRRTLTDLEFWIDGVLSLSISNPMLNDVNVEGRCKAGNVLDPDAPAYLGYSPAYDGYWFNGKVDELRVYSRALSPEEIKAFATK